MYVDLFGRLPAAAAVAGPENFPVLAWLERPRVAVELQETVLLAVDETLLAIRGPC